MTDDFAIRPALERDLDRLVEIHAASYPDDRTHAQRERTLRFDGLGTLAELRVVERRGQVIGYGRLCVAETWLGGQPVRVGVIGSLAVAPEARKLGAASALVSMPRAISASRSNA